ncbi:MAG: hypothetical protein ACJ79S_09575 [Gemmatimonadaceae bacterium]
MKPKQRQASTSLAISVALHLVLGAVLVRVLTLPLPLHDLFEFDKGSSPPVERISFIALPKAGPVTTAGRSGGDGRPKSAQPPAPLRAPSAVPEAVPAAPAAPATTGGSGEVIGRGGAEEGIRPSFGDPRVWVPPADVVSAPKSPTERLDSSLTARLRAHRDSLAVVAHVPSKAERGDWTVERDGKKYGIDQKFIHLGKFSLPTAALALLPLNTQANPIAARREQALDRMRADIQFQAQRAMNEEEFRDAVKAIRERKERERAAARQAETVAGKGGSR